MTPFSRVIGSDAAGAVPFTFAAFGTPEPVDDAAAATAFAEGIEVGLAQRGADVAALEARIESLEADLAAAATASDATADVGTLVAEAAGRLVEAWHEAVRAREPELTALALDVAEAVLGAPPTAEQRAATATAIAQAVDALAADGPVTVALHPVDLLHLQEAGLADALAGAHGGLRWEPDAALAEGDWSASTPEAAVQRLRAPMVAAARERLGLPATPDVP